MPASQLVCTWCSYYCFRVKLTKAVLLLDCLVYPYGRSLHSLSWILSRLLGTSLLPFLLMGVLPCPSWLLHSLPACFLLLNRSVLSPLVNSIDYRTELVSQQHAILINQVQAPEDAVAPPPPRPVQQELPLTPQTVNPAPPTAPPRPTGPTFLSLLFQHIRSDPQARICEHPGALIITSDVRPGLGMFFFLTFIVRVIVTPSLALVFVASMYSLFWLPQIVRSVKKGRSSALTAEYLIGTSFCRLFHALCEYRHICGRFMSDTSSDFLTCPKNVLDVEPRRKSESWKN
jgi:hypothetical protein